jgi:hypothetical protein
MDVDVLCRGRYASGRNRMIQQVFIMITCMGILGPAFHFVLDVDPHL